MTAGDRFYIESDTGDSIELESDILLGRSDDCDLVLTQGHPSRRHAQLTVTAEGVSIEDLGSANGSFVNGERLSSKRPLKHGDKLKFDLEEYRFTVIGEAATSDEDAQTIIRSVEDLQQTIIRPAAELMAEVEASKAKMANKAEADFSEAEGLVEKLEGQTIQITLKANDEGTLYAAVSAAKVVSALKEKGLIR